MDRSAARLVSGKDEDETLFGRLWKQEKFRRSSIVPLKFLIRSRRRHLGFTPFTRVKDVTWLCGRTGLPDSAIRTVNPRKLMPVAVRSG